MGNKRNKTRRKKRRTGDFLTEWKVLNSFGLVKSRSEKAKSALPCALPVDDVVSAAEQLGETAAVTEEEFQPVQPTPEDPTTPFQDEFQPNPEDPTTPFQDEFQPTPEDPTTPFQDEFQPTPEDPTTPFQDEFQPTTPLQEEPALVLPQVDGMQYLTGRRIVDVGYFISEIKKMSNHGERFGCTLDNMVFQKEIIQGLRSGFEFICSMCSMSYIVWSEAESTTAMNINEAAVAAVMGTGGGYSTLSEMLSGFDVRCMNSKTYDRIHKKVAKGWEDTALEEMRAAAAEEARLARERGDVDRYGVPLLTVVTDASWAKRSYRNNYNSLSGVAAIVGYHTKKVLHIGVKNKYCTTCARSSEPNKTRPHACFKNWNESSCSMESAGVVEGFLSSQETYGVKYTTIIADGDSSVLQKINETRPYADTRVEKIECRNHLLRNYCNKIKEISQTPLKNRNLHRGSYCRLRKQVGASILRLRGAVTKAIDYRKKEPGNLSSKAQKLRRDIINGPCHVFGDHDRCDNYFCKGSKENECNKVPELKKFGIYPMIMQAVQNLADKSKDLIYDVDSNMAEHYNAAVARLIGGKRINYCLKNSYQARCAAAVVSYNSGKTHYKLHKHMYKSSPGAFCKRFEERKLRKVQLARLRRLRNPKPRRRLLSAPTDTKTYGPLCNKPDLEADVYAQKLNEHWERLRLTDDERNAVERNTREQNESDLWMEERRIRLTASNFGVICNRKPYSNSSPVVTSLLYFHKKDCAATAYGKENEAKAIEDLSNHLGKPVKRCGLFIDEKLPFLAATPDGLIGSDTIVEVKCPFSGKDLTPDEVIQQKVGIVGSLFFENKKSQTIEIKKRHRYHFQVQGQLHITKRDLCVFALWTPLGLKTFNVSRDDQFWEREMVDKLTVFYNSCLLPELLDPRKRRSMPLREPPHIREAQKRREKPEQENENLAVPLC